MDRTHIDPELWSATSNHGLETPGNRAMCRAEPARDLHDLTPGIMRNSVSRELFYAWDRVNYMD